MPNLSLRKTTEADLNVFFEYQLDEEARNMAAFTAPDPTDRTAYFEKWTAILKNERVNTQTILQNGQIVGSVARYEMHGEPQVTYWIDKAFWGQGIASAALALFLQQETVRPIYGGAAKDNVASRRVLEKCGFVLTGEDIGYSNARKQDIAEVFYRLDK